MSLDVASRAAFPLPELDWEPTRPFWEAAARGELRIPRCGSCGSWCWYPAEACRACGAGELAWTRVRGRGTLFSWTVVRRPLAPGFAELTPYAPGLVCLDEDPALRLVTRLVDCAPEALRIGMPLAVVFRPLRFAGVEGEVLGPLFAPAE